MKIRTFIDEDGDELRLPEETNDFFKYLKDKHYSDLPASFGPFIGPSLHIYGATDDEAPDKYLAAFSLGDDYVDVFFMNSIDELFALIEKFRPVIEFATNNTLTRLQIGMIAERACEHVHEDEEEYNETEETKEFTN